MIYGDSVGHEVEFLTNYAATKMMIYEQQSSYSEPLRNSVIEGGDDEFIAAMLPSKQHINTALKEIIAPWLKACERDAKDAGRSIWGWKIAGVNPLVVKTLATILPQARFVTLSRPLEETVKSAKASGHFQCEQGLAHFCQTWVQGEKALKELNAMHTDRVLSLNYHEMLEKKLETINLLESFTAAENIAADVFDRKLNNQNSPTATPPANLNESEQKIVDSYNNPLISNVA